MTTKRTQKKKTRTEVLNETNLTTLLGPEYEVKSDKEVEEFVLGALLTNSSNCDTIFNEITKDAFYYSVSKTIFLACKEIYDKNAPIDILTLTKHLRNKERLEEVGGAYYISTLTDKFIGSIKLEHYLLMLKEYFLRRILISDCTQTIRKALDENEDVFDTFSELEGNLSKEIKNVAKIDYSHVWDIHNQNMGENLDILMNGKQSGVPTAIRSIDNVTNGWQKSDLVIIAGRPGMGKTSVALTFALNPSIKEKIPTAIFSCEMSKAQLVGRIQSALSGVNVSDIIKKKISEDDYTKIKDSCEVLEETPIFIDDTPSISILELKIKARDLVRTKGVKLLIVDYIQLMTSHERGNREQEIASISRGLKGIAKELDVPVIALSQLSRAVEARADKKPQLSDLRESGQIEQDADMVMFCYRPEYYGIEQYEVGGEVFDSNELFMMLVSKHRNGECGEIPLRFIGEQTKVLDLGEETPTQTTSDLMPQIEDEPIDDDIPF